MSSNPKREALAAVSHDIWAHWMKWQFSCCQQNEDGSLTIPAAKVERWTRQLNTNYSDLSEDEKESDRHQADKILEALASSKAELTSWIVMQSKFRLMVIAPGYPAGCGTPKALDEEYFAGEVIAAETPEDAAQKYCISRDLNFSDFRVHIYGGN